MLLKQVLREKMYYIIVIYKMLYIYIVLQQVFVYKAWKQSAKHIFITPSHTRDYLNKVAKIYKL